MIEAQIKLEEAHIKNHLYSRINKYWKECGLLAAIEADIPSLDQKLVSKILTQTFLHKRVPVGTLVGMFLAQYPTETILETVDALISLGAVKYQDKKLIVVLSPSEEIQDDIDTYQYPIPMVVEPEILYTNQDSGYITIRKNIVLQAKGSEGDYCLDVVNTLNQIPLTMDYQLAKDLQPIWKGLAKQKPLETVFDHQKKLKAYDRYVKSSKEVIEAMSLFPEFYMTHSYDKRGRIYANGYHINPQGCDYNKAVILFKNQERIEL